MLYSLPTHNVRFTSLNILPHTAIIEHGHKLVSPLFAAEKLLMQRTRSCYLAVLEHNYCIVYGNALILLR